MSAALPDDPMLGPPMEPPNPTTIYLSDAQVKLAETIGYTAQALCQLEINYAFAKWQRMAEEAIAQKAVAIWKAATDTRKTELETEFKDALPPKEPLKGAEIAPKDPIVVEKPIAPIADDGIKG